MRTITIVTASVATALAISSLAGAGGAGPYGEGTGGSTVQQTATTNGPVQTSSKRFKPIRGAAPTLPQAPRFPEGLYWFESATVTVMVVLRSGKGSLRVVDGPDDTDLEVGAVDGTRMYPRSVPIAGRGPHTVQFILPNSDSPGEIGAIFPPQVEWKRKGKKPLKAATVVTSIQGEVD